jgi:hypothetical protein
MNIEFFNSHRAKHSLTPIGDPQFNQIVLRCLEVRAAELNRLVDPAEKSRWQGELDELEDRQHLAASLPGEGVIKPRLSNPTHVYSQISSG